MDSKDGDLKSLQSPASVRAFFDNPADMRFPEPSGRHTRSPLSGRARRLVAARGQGGQRARGRARARVTEKWDVEGW
jgi:hypothetical protein